MNDILYNSFVEEWIPKQSNILADLEYDRNLADNLAVTEMMYWKFSGLLNMGHIAKEDSEKWQALGFTILSLQHRIYNKMPDFSSRQRPQLLALSREVIKEERFHNDAILSRGNNFTEAELLQQIKSNKVLVSDAFITPDKTLKIIVKNYVEGTLEHVATRFSREIDAHDVALNKLIFYDEADAEVIKDVTGVELFVKPL